MNRLTFEGNFCDIAQCFEVRGGEHCPDGYCSQRKVWERLKEYEDTGLEPESIKRVFNEDAVLSLAGQCLGTTPDRLRELVRAEQDGRLVVLPCKVGTHLWRVTYPYRLPPKVTEYIVTNFRTVTKKNKLQIEVRAINVPVSNWMYYDDFYTTREDAEAALEAQKGGDRK